MRSSSPPPTIGMPGRRSMHSAARKHVYCEKPMTHSVDEALDVYRAWKASGLVMQVGVQSTALPVLSAINKRICAGDLGKIVQYQTEFYRNSDMGQWRYYELTKDMTPKNIDWPMFLGTEFGLAPAMPFDRAKFGQWRCYWDFGSGMFTDLFVHRTTSMLKATGLRFPGRVVALAASFSNTTAERFQMSPRSSQISRKEFKESSPRLCAVQTLRSSS